MKAIRIHSSDTVAVAVEDLHPGDTVTVDFSEGEFTFKKS